VRPSGLFLFSPVLSLKESPTTSRTLFMMDAVLPMNLINNCRAHYLPAHSDANTDPCLSPIVASDAHLQKFPPTSIMVGSLDPYLDDTVQFAHRLHAVGVGVRLKMFSKLPHTFLSFAALLPEAHRAVEMGGRWLRSSVALLVADETSDNDDGNATSQTTTPERPRRYAPAKYRDRVPVLKLS
jgi:acetyl esterase/lipase